MEVKERKLVGGGGELGHMVAQSRGKGELGR